MNTLAITNLNISKELDTQSLAEIAGCGHFHKISSSIRTGSWSAYRKFYQGPSKLVFHYGRLKRRTQMGYNRTRVQTETSYWNFYA